MTVGQKLVAPHAGAWIEIFLVGKMQNTQLSLPTRERGLKCPEYEALYGGAAVAPHAGAWIEIVSFSSCVFSPLSLPKQSWIQMHVSSRYVAQNNPRVQVLPSRAK